MNELSDIETSPAAEAPLSSKSVPMPEKSAESYFLGPEAQIDKMRRWAEKYRWPIGERELKRLPLPPNVQNPEVAFVLTPEFGEHQKTMLGLLDPIRDSYRKSYIVSLLQDRELHYSNDVRPKGFFWYRLRVRGSIPKRAAMYPNRCPSTAVLAFTAMHTAYISSMNGGTNPYLWVPGFQVHLREGFPQPKTAQIVAPGRAEINGRMRISYDRGIRGLSILVDFFGGKSTATPCDPYTAIPHYF